MEPREHRSGFRLMSGQSELYQVQARLRKGLDEISALRSNRWTEEAGKWAGKIRSVTQEGEKANAIFATGRRSVQQSAEHLKLLAKTFAVVQAAAGAHSDSLESGNWAIVLACEEFKRRSGSPNQPESLPESSSQQR
jgi:hypothetical protein